MSAIDATTAEPATESITDPRAGWSHPENDPWGPSGHELFPYPRFPSKHAQRSVTSPEAFAPVPLERIPRTVFLCYTKFLETAVARVVDADPGSRESSVVSGLHFLSNGNALSLNTSHLGAPGGVAQLERQIHLGVRSFVIAGLAGSVRAGTGIGQVVVAQKAIRDEGTSHHYLPPTEFAWPAPGIDTALARHLEAKGIGVQVGGTWTTDAIFRETHVELQELGCAGIITVEMEASAVVTVARFRGVRAGAVFVVSDLVHRPDWERGQDGVALEDSILRLLPALVSFDFQSVPNAAIGELG